MTISAEIKKIFDEILSPITKGKILNRTADEIRDIAAAYPEEGIWNSPSQARWYQRHFGARYRRRDGTIGGRNTSQRLQKSWVGEVSENSAGAYTGVTYAPFLMDAERRAFWAREHGWATTDEILENFYPRFEEIVFDEIDSANK